MAELTDAQIEREADFLKGLPRINIAALLLPPIWGPFHGFWITILYYPAWILTDNLIYAAWVDPSTMSIFFAALTVLTLLALTIIFSIVSQPIAAHKAEDKGVSRQEYLRKQRYWAIGCAIGAVIMLALASYYNVFLRTP